MSLVQDSVEEYFADADLTHDDLDAVLAAVRHHFGEHADVTDPALVGEHAYLSPTERYVATLAVSYDHDEDGVASPEEALRAALALTEDMDADSTQWWVYDRHTRTGRIIEQGDVTDVVVP